ncbi:hypothetical protein F5890DRAFT_1189447 [Lentinula detonsa]|uniref:Secreted protein n=1 Tax=Lentinula detonsa TaxID=2804962 RepID=A0AA38Q8Q4_9AGAR|nr:hypothetical protein F5890DRAFT_1189447 [Lentinula detonsa]
MMVYNIGKKNGFCAILFFSFFFDGCSPTRTLQARDMCARGFSPVTPSCAYRPNEPSGRGHYSGHSTGDDDELACLKRTSKRVTRSDFLPGMRQMYCLEQDASGPEGRQKDLEW